MRGRAAGSVGTEENGDVVTREIAEELRFHIEGRARELAASGWSERDARAEAARRFGDVDRIGAECREVSRQRIRRQRRGELMSTLWQDMRYGTRTLRKSPAFAVIAILTLGLGIGATTAIFTVLDAVVLRPLPLDEPERLVVVWEEQEAQGLRKQPPSPANFADWRAAQRTFAGLAAWMETSLTWTATAEPQVLSAVAASANVFDVLGARPMLGRGFAEGDDARNGAPVVVLSHGAWQGLFGGDPDVIGRTMQLNNTPVEVVGVMPPSFRVPRPEVALWIPEAYDEENSRQRRYLQVVGRLASGATVAQANADLNAIAARLDELYPESNEGWRVSVVPALDEILGGTRSLLLIVFVAVAFVLILACVNVANLVLGRSIAREAELAVRAALGASRARLRSQLLTENLLLGVAGGAVGVAFAYVGVRVFLAVESGTLPRADEVAVDVRVLAFALIASLGTGLAFGLFPVAQSSRVTPENALRDTTRAAGTRRRESARKVLIAAELALSVVLLAGAGLALRSLQKLNAVDPGYDKAGVLAGRVDLDQAAYPDNDARRRYFEQLVDRLEAVPGVERAAVASTLPLTHGIDFNLPYRAEGQPELPEQQLPQADYRVISPGYVEALGIPVLRGRTFSMEDRAESRRVLLINRSFAELLWPGQDPIGKSITIYYVQNQPWEVVGVIGDTRHLGFSTPSSAQMFVPAAQAEVLFDFMTIVVRKRVDTPGLERAVREAAVGLDANEPLYQFETMEGLVADATARDRLAALVFGLFALLAIGLSAAGIYGVISYQVAQRTREIGVRMALGAARYRVVTDMVREAAVPAVFGIALGLAGAAAGTRVASGWLYGISATDPVTFTTVSTLLLGVALLAALVPAWRAASIHPLQALRRD